MTKQGKRTLQARRTESATDDDSLLVRSAESLGRVIGSLQRQVRRGSKRVNAMAGGALKALPGMSGSDGGFDGTSAKKRKASATGRSASRKAAGTSNGSGARGKTPGGGTTRSRNRAGRGASAKKR